MNRLVSYTSSDDDDNDSSVSQECGSLMFETKLCRNNEYIGIVSPDKMVNINTSHIQDEPFNVTGGDMPGPDLPITDESDDQTGNFVNSDSDNCSELSHSTKLSLVSHQSKSETIELKDSSRIDSLTITVTGDVDNTITSHLIPACHQTHFYPQTASVGNLQVQTSHISVMGDKSNLLIATDIHSQLSPCSEEDHSFTRSSSESLSSVQTVRSETAPCILPNKKRKLSDDSKKHLDIPDSIQSMFLNKHHRWTDDPAQHNNRTRSFPHLGGNWATHVYIPVARTEQFVKFVDELLGMLMPPTFQTQPDFHVSLSRTVTIRYHWIELLVDSLREQFKSLTSCISDLTSVKLFTNDEKTRTFVVIELSLEDYKEFMDYVKAVDKSFAEFKLPAYYENASFHISVGWCLGDATSDIPAEKLSKAQEMLADFVAANSDLGFVYVHQICCQTGCKSFVITLPDSGS